MNFRQKVVIGVLDVLMIAQLCVSMYLANQDPDNFTPAFVKSFFAMAVPTLIAARIAFKLLRTAEPESPE